MFSSSGDRTKADNLSRNSNAERPPSAIERADLEQAFALIDGILPFEACLYYQVVPLSIEGSRLNLGMVNPDDQIATEYVRRQVSYINCSIVTSGVPSDWHRDILSQYLSHTAKAKQQKAQKAQKLAKAKETGETSPPQHPAKADPHGTHATLLVDTPDSFNERSQDQSSPKTDPSPAQSEPLSTQPTPVAIPSINQLEQADPQPLQLDIEADHPSLALDRLALLPPKEMMEALLSKVLDEGIGRLYFERQVHTGRILWSKDGMLQSVLEDVDAVRFQGVINELKLLVHLSLIEVQKPRQVEIERLHSNSRVLLRFRVMPGKHGEEATLQVLRGAALKFYQQQQVDKLGRDALTVAHTLQQRLNEMRDRAREDLSLSTVVQTESLPAIIQLLKQMEQQVQELIDKSDDSLHG